MIRVFFRTSSINFTVEIARLLSFSRYDEIVLVKSIFILLLNYKRIFDRNDLSVVHHQNNILRRPDTRLPQSRAGGQGP